MKQPKRKSQRGKIVPDWLPDWTDDSQYPNTQTTSLIQWAWEFLRRNVEYQKQWEKTVQHYINSKGHFDFAAEHEIATTKISTSTDYLLKVKTFQEKWPEIDNAKGFIDRQELLAELSDSNPAFKIHYDSLTISVPCPLQNLYERFGVSTFSVMPPSLPSDQLPQDLIFNQNLFRIHFYEHPSNFQMNFFKLKSPYNISAEIKPNEIMCVFDLEMPIEPQLKMVKPVLQQRQKLAVEKGEISFKVLRNREPKLYKQYLRILDAETNGASPKDMQKIIGGDGWRACDYLQAAQRLSNSDYLFIPKFKAK